MVIWVSGIEGEGRWGGRGESRDVRAICTSGVDGGR